MTAVQKAKMAIVDEFVGLDAEKQKRLSKLIAKLCVAAVKEDRALRSPPPNPIAKIFDVFFNGRPA